MEKGHVIILAIIVTVLMGIILFELFGR